MAALRAYLLIDPLILLSTVLMGTLSLIATLFDSTGRVPHKIARLWSRMVLAVSGVRVRAEGIENILPDAGYVVVSNHVSLMDTPLLLAYLPLQFRFLAKVSLFKVPFIGYHLSRAGHIPIPRGDARGSARAMTEAARAIRERGISALVFPEGTRSKGELQEFKEGAAYIAIKAAAPVLPVAIQGSGKVLPSGSILVRPGRVSLRVGDPIPTAGLTLHDRGRLTQQVRDRILDLLSAPVQSAA